MGKVNKEQELVQKMKDVNIVQKKTKLKTKERTEQEVPI